jgi:hypothetical protein
MRSPISTIVMRGLDPRIHLFRKNLFKGWIAGSSPAMTMHVVGSAA